MASLCILDEGFLIPEHIIDFSVENTFDLREESDQIIFLHLRNHKKIDITRWSLRALGQGAVNQGVLRLPFQVLPHDVADVFRFQKYRLELAQKNTRGVNRVNAEVCLFCLFDKVQGGRSEEHTSELQS